MTDNEYLFNIDDDPAETFNLVDQHPDIARSLAELLNQIREQTDTGVAL